MKNDMDESGTSSEPNEIKANQVQQENSASSAELSATQPLEPAVPEDAGDAVEKDEESVDDTNELDGVAESIISPPASVIKKDGKGVVQRESVIKVVKRCDLGAIRDRNEDSCLAFTSDSGGHFKMMPFGLYIVADGMGGHANGHVASKVASRTAAEYVLNHVYFPLLLEDEDPPTIQDILEKAVWQANKTIYEDEPENDSGTTLTIALILGRRLYIAHVGDSRIYLFADDKLQTLTNDHSLVQRLQDVGHITAEEAVYYQYRNVLLRAVGQVEEVEADIYTRALPQAGRLLLCSDGLCSMITDKQIAEILQRSDPLDKSVDDLYDAAMDAGGYDNITVMLVEFSI